MQARRQFSRRREAGGVRSPRPQGPAGIAEPAAAQPRARPGAHDASGRRAARVVAADGALAEGVARARARAAGR